MIWRYSIARKHQVPILLMAQLPEASLKGVLLMRPSLCKPESEPNLTLSCMAWDRKTQYSFERKSFADQEPAPGALGRYMSFLSFVDHFLLPMSSFLHVLLGYHEASLRMQYSWIPCRVSHELGLLQNCFMAQLTAQSDLGKLMI